MAQIASATVSEFADRNRVILWDGMGDDDIGGHITTGPYADGSVQATGIWDSATLTLEGSNDGSNWFVLRDDTGVAVSMTADGLQMFMQRTALLRVQTAGGQGSTNLDIHLCIGG